MPLHEISRTGLTTLSYYLGFVLRLVLRLVSGFVLVQYLCYVTSPPGMTISPGPTTGGVQRISAFDPLSGVSSGVSHLTRRS